MCRGFSPLLHNRSHVFSRSPADLFDERNPGPGWLLLLLLLLLRDDVSSAPPPSPRIGRIRFFLGRASPQLKHIKTCVELIKVGVEGLSRVSKAPGLDGECPGSPGEGNGCGPGSIGGILNPAPPPLPARVGSHAASTTFSQTLVARYGWTESAQSGEGQDQQWPSALG